MSSEPYLLILAHGWNSHPGIWNRLVPRLSEASIPFWNFDHTIMNGADLPELAAALGASIGDMRDETGFRGWIVPHSESRLPGISLDILPAGPDGEVLLPSPDQYCHINLPKNPLVIDRIIHYLTCPVL